MALHRQREAAQRSTAVYIDNQTSCTLHRVDMRLKRGPSFAYSPSLHSLHARRDRVPLVWRAHTKSTTTRAEPGSDLAVLLE